MKPILFSLGKVNIYTHGTFLVVSVLISSYLMYVLAKFKKLNTELIFDLVVFGLLAGLLFARVSYFVFYRDQFSSVSEIFKIWQGGLVSWGGFLGAIITFLIILKLYKEPVAKWFDLISICAILALSIGRLGSYLSGELAGKSTHFFLSVNSLYPVTLYESIILFLLFMIFIYLYVKDKIKHDGLLFAAVLVVYCLMRFALDFIRNEEAKYLILTINKLIRAVIADLVLI